MVVIRIPKDSEEAWETFKGEHKIKNDSDAFRRILEDLKRLSEENKKLRENQGLKLQNSNTEAEEEETELPECHYATLIDNGMIQCDSKYRKGTRKIPLKVCWTCYKRKQWAKEQKEETEYNSESKEYCAMKNSFFPINKFPFPECEGCPNTKCRHAWKSSIPL